MKSTAIQETLAKILEIDQASIDMEQGIDALKGVKEKELKKKEREVDQRYMREARKAGKEGYDRVMEKAQLQESEILEEGEIIDRRLRRLYEKNEVDLVREAMVRIFGDAFEAKKE